MRKTIAIVHYNTPAVTEALVLSIRRQCGSDWRVVIFENSDVEPLQRRMRGMEIIDNTRQQMVDFNEELKKYQNKRPEKSCYGRSVFGSVKHSMSVEWLVQNMETPFILADSDILLKGNIDELWDESVTAAGTVEKEWNYGVQRLLPFLCFINAPECRRLGIHYYDPMRTWGLGTGKTEKENWYDTGASFLEDINRTDGVSFKKVVTGSMMVHLGGASYVRTREIPEWLFAHRDLWNPDYQYNGKRTIISETNMENIKVMTQDNRQFHLTADAGFLLKSKTTGRTFKVIDTCNLKDWESVNDPDATAEPAKPSSKKKAPKVKRSGTAS